MVSPFQIKLENKGINLMRLREKKKRKKKGKMGNEHKENQKFAAIHILQPRDQLVHSSTSSLFFLQIITFPLPLLMRLSVMLSFAICIKYFCASLVGMRMLEGQSGFRLGHTVYLLVFCWRRLNNTLISPAKPICLNLFCTWKFVFCPPSLQDGCCIV